MKDDFGAALEAVAHPVFKVMRDDLLSQLRRARERYDSVPEPFRQAAAMELVAQSMMFASMLIGPDVVAKAYGPDPGPDDPDNATLIGLYYRLRPLTELYGLLDSSASKASIRALQKEILAVAAGDAPKLFARLKSKAGRGKRTQAYRMSFHYLNALEMIEFLQTLGLGAGQALAKVADAYGAAASTVADWRGMVSRTLGEQQLEDHLRTIRLGGHPKFWQIHSLADAESLMKKEAAGRAEEERDKP